MEEFKDISKKRARVDLEEAESHTNSPEVKRVREDLLDSFDDDEICTGSQDLDSFIKSFEEEITASPSAATAVEVVDLTLDNSRLDLGYLLEASDDELGLPPTTSPSTVVETELIRVESGSSELGGEFWESPDLDEFGFGLGESDNYDGGFDYSDLDFGSNGFS